MSNPSSTWTFRTLDYSYPGLFGVRTIAPSPRTSAPRTYAPGQTPPGHVAPWFSDHPGQSSPQEHLSPNNHGALPLLIFHACPPFPPLSFLSTPPSSSSFPFHPFMGEATLFNRLGRLGERCKLPSRVRLSRHRLWCILRGKNSFDSNYYMDFCIQKNP